MDCGMGEVPLHCQKLGLSVIFGIVQLHSSPLHVSQLVLVCSVPVYVRNDPWVFKVDEGIVDKEAASGRGMKNVEVSVFDPSAVEVGRGEGLGM